MPNTTPLSLRGGEQYSRTSLLRLLSCTALSALNSPAAGDCFVICVQFVTGHSQSSDKYLGV